MVRTLLIVDDVKSNRDILKNILGSEYAVLEASNGQEALTVMNASFEKLSAVLLDLRMPVMDGFEVLGYMRSSRVLSQLPVIVMTGEADQDTEEQALKLGAKDYISKPYQSAIIKQRIGNTINLRETAATVNALRRDRLTGLYSREAFFEQVALMTAAHEPGYYIMACFDVDKFKVINDQYGTKKGDEALRHIANVFREGFEAQGGICCRVSGDDFVTLYPATFRDTKELAEIRRRAGLVEGLLSPIAFSIGRYLVNDLSLAPAAMYDRAMLAADSIKGRYDVNIATYDESLRKQLIRVQEIVTDMNAALSERQFEVWFQPQYNHSTGAVIGAEALARWRHPQKGLISPGVFVPVFEKTGFIYELDKYVWEDVCRFLRRKLDEGDFPLPVSVNISRYDVFQPDVIDVIVGLTQKYQLPSGLLRLEITESAFAESTKEIVSVVKQLIDIGFTLEIDDFGSGYSSLNTLKNVPAQVVKLDMRFFQDDDDSQRSGNIVESVVRMTKWLGMSVIAEGVELVSQADFLQSVGCNYIQGYLYAKPMPMNEYDHFTAGSRKEEKLIVMETVENLDNDAFWDPSSMDTLIFNSYVGGACIMEYRNGSIELLRASRKYAEVIGGKDMTVEMALKMDWRKHMSEDGWRVVVKDIEKSISKRSEIAGEYIFLDLPGCPHETYLSCTLRAIASVGDRHLIYCLNENITAQRESEKRERDVAQRMRLIMDNVSSGICASVLDADGGVSILFANDAYYAMMGYTKEQFDQELSNPMDAMCPEDREQATRIIGELIQNGGSAMYMYHCVKRNGEIITVRCNNTVAAFEGMTEKVLLGVIADITELHKMQETEKRLSEQMRAIMDNVDLGILATIVKDGTAQYLFTNDHYFDMLGYTKEQFESEIASPYQTIAEEDLQRVKELTARINLSGEPIAIAYTAVRRDGRKIVVRAAISLCELAGVSGPVQLTILRDITQERESELRERRAAEQLKVIMSDIGSGVNASLFDKDGKIVTFFCNETFYTMRGYTRQQFLAEVSDSADLVHPDDREWVLREAKRAYAAETPTQFEYRTIQRDGEVRWFRVSISSTRFTGVDANVHLCVFNDVTESKRQQQEIQAASEQLTSMMNDMPGGFARMRADADGRLHLDYCNEGFLKLVNMSRQELFDGYQDHTPGLLHPEDRAAVHQVVLDAIQYGEAQSGRYRQITGGGEYVWLSMFARVTKDDTGSTFVNLYFTDRSERVREEENRKDLLDNLPGGAALYMYDHGAINAVHLNKRYWELVGRAPETASNTPLEAIHPDDQAVVYREVLSAIEQHRDVACDARLRYGVEGYRPFHITGRVVPTGEEQYSIYATFLPITSEAMSYQQMLPLLLSAIMQSTTDLSFAKDKELRYLTASRAFANMVGYEDEKALIGKTDFDLFESSLAEKYRADDLEMLLGGKPIIDNVEALPPVNGVPHYSSTSKYRLLDASGEIIGLYGVGRDVTESIIKETQLSLVNDSIPGGLASYVCTKGAFSALNIRIAYFNDGFCRLFGYTRAEFEKDTYGYSIGRIFAEDKHILADQWAQMMKKGTPVDCLCRSHIKDGGYKWINHKAVVADRQKDKVVINAILQDVTDQRELIEQLRISEEENNLAVHLGGNIVCRFSVADRSLSLSRETAAFYALPEVIQDVPEEPIRLHMISPESADAYRGFFGSILNGSKAATVMFQQNYSGQWRWMEAKSSTIFSDEGAPVKAVISMMDVTERLEKETVYRKWQQSLSEKIPSSYTLIRYNLNSDDYSAKPEGTLITFNFDTAGNNMNERTREYVRQRVYEEDRDRYTAFINSDILLAGYYRGNRSEVLEYRENQPDGSYRWQRLTVDLVEYPQSTEVEAYLLFENIDESKRAELHTQEMAQSDQLTGVLNRSTFTAKVTEKIKAAKPEERSALLMLDLDGFKLVNDVFGHSVGDQALVDVAESMRAILRRDDLIGRIGGDEFMVFLSDVGDDTSIAGKAMQICAVTRKSFSVEVQISASIGIAITPRDGMDFDMLYRKADAALYYVKGTGKDSCAFYRDDMADEHLELDGSEEEYGGTTKRDKKRRILIVDDNKIDHAVLSNIFADTFIIEKAKDGNSALIRLRHYGTAISVVLLDLMMPGMDGFAVLRKMQENLELRSVPVIAVSGDESIETNLKAIQAGAVDFVSKPVNAEILRIRVQSAISKAENERLRAKNSVLEYKEGEVNKYKSVLERSGIVVIEHEWVTGKFTYDPNLSKYVAGKYDERGLWHILLADFVADTQTVKKIQETVHDVAIDSKRSGAELFVRLKTPSKEIHWFRLTMSKIVDDFNLASKLYLSLIDLGTALPSQPDRS